MKCTYRKFDFWAQTVSCIVVVSTRLASLLQQTYEWHVWHIRNKDKKYKKIHNGCLSVPTEECFQAWVARKKVTSSPGLKKNQLSGLSVRPANGMSSVLNIQSVFVFSIHPRGQTNILASWRVSYHIQTLKLGLFWDRRRVGTGGKRLGGPLKNLWKQLMLRLPKLHRIMYSSIPTYRRNVIDTMT